jgi:cardiolipin synthase
MPRPNKVGGAQRSLWARVRYALRRELGYRSPASRIARGMSAGFFAVAVPLPVAQLPLSILLAWFVRGAKGIAILPQLFTSLGISFPLAIVQFKIGAELWPWHTPASGHAIRTLDALIVEWQWGSVFDSAANLYPALRSVGLHVAGPTVVGVVITGLALALLAYPPSLITVWTWRKWRHSRRLRRGPLSGAPAPLLLPVADDHPPVLAEALARYARFPGQFQRAAAVKLLVNGGEAFPDMLAAIDAAATTIDLETYMFRADRTGARFHVALRKAAQRGVRVRVIYDYIGSRGIPDRFVRKLVRSGVEVAVYHPPLFDRAILLMNQRDHRKILVVDRRILFIGGLNISDDNAAVEEGGQGWRDTHMRIDGRETARAGERLFDSGWQDATPYGEMRTPRSRFEARIRTRLKWLTTLTEMEKTQDVASDAPGVAVQIIGNEEFRFRRRIRRAYLHAIKRARRYILIENAYFIPDRGMRRALTRAVRRGVFVAVAVARHSDVAAAAYASRSLYSELLERGVRIFEWPYGMLHAKTAVIDDAWAIVGSYNFDRRSLLHQLEVVAVVADADFAKRLRDQTMADLAESHEVTMREHESRSWAQMLLESGATILRPWL